MGRKEGRKMENTNKNENLELAAFERISAHLDLLAKRARRDLTRESLRAAAAQKEGDFVACAVARQRVAEWKRRLEVIGRFQDEAADAIERRR